MKDDSTPHSTKLHEDFLSDTVILLLKTLESHNHSAEVVGGAVRDELLGYSSHEFVEKGGDYDITTSASVEELKRIFVRYKQIPDGEEFGTVKLLINGDVFEITTYRTDGPYRDGRRPEEVIFTTDITEDLARRDFTINAMARNLDNQLIDPFAGKSDLEMGLVRTVGDPFERFNEDYLRMLRAIRFATVLNFELEESTSQAIIQIQLQSTAFADQVSSERKMKEMQKIMESDAKRGMDLLRKHQLLKDVTPLADLVGARISTPWGSIDLYDHVTKGLTTDIDWLVKYAILGHEMGYHEGTNFPTKAAEIMESYLREMSMPNEDRNHVVNLIRYQEIPESIIHDNSDDRILRNWLLKITDVYSKKQSKREIISHKVYDFFSLARAHLKGNIVENLEESIQTYEKINFQLNKISTRIAKIREEIAPEETYSNSALVSGHKIMKLGVRGPLIGLLMQEVVLYNPTTEEEGLKIIQQLLQDDDLTDPQKLKHEFSLRDDWFSDELMKRRRRIDKLRSSNLS